MNCIYCNEEIHGDATVDDGKIYHRGCLIDYKDEHKAATYPFIDEDFLNMEELEPYLEDTVDSNKWVIILCCREYGIYGVESVDSKQKAINIIHNPNFDGNGWDSVVAVYHNGKQMTTTITLT